MAGRQPPMGKKKWCFGREDVICLTKDCPYMSDCIQVVWRRKMARLIGKGTALGEGTIPKLKSTVKKEAVVEKEKKRRALAAK
jgi:hypothetical protein